MRETVLTLNNGQWIDLVAPTASDIPVLAKRFNLPEKTLLSCLDPEYLPKLEQQEDCLFLITRVFDKADSKKGDTVQELTTKLCFFISKDRVVTIHRVDHSFIDQLKVKLSQIKGGLDLKSLILQLISESIISFDIPLAKLEDQVTLFEQFIFKNPTQKKIFQDGFLLKRKANVFRKVLKLSSDVISNLTLKAEFKNHDFQEIRTTLDTLLFYAEEVLDNVSNLIHLYVSITSQKTNEASYKTNEIVRILTVFSIFFLPLNFLAGVYGMNFENMPELKSEYGYYVILSVMASISLGLFIWMFRRGWIKGLNGSL